MRRVCLAAIATALFALCLQRHASAMAEFCPASLTFKPVPKTSNEPVSLYGFELGALGPRTIASATLAFDTSVGWYSVDVSTVALVEKERHYTGPSSSFIRHEFASAVMYVRFPTAVTIAHAWVYRASAVNDGPFGWQRIGNVQCDPPAAPSASQLRHPAAVDDPFKLDPKDEDALSAPPQTTSLVLAATATTALQKTDCAEPFAYATVKDQAQPEFPPMLREGFAGRATVAVRVAIDADGVLRDAWTWYPSGYQAFDDEAVSAAKLSSYVPARAYCKAVPGSYLFRVTFANP